MSRKITNHKNKTKKKKKRKKKVRLLEKEKEKKKSETTRKEKDKGHEEGKEDKEDKEEKEDKENKQDKEDNEDKQEKEDGQSRRTTSINLVQEEHRIRIKNVIDQNEIQNRQNERKLDQGAKMVELIGQLVKKEDEKDWVAEVKALREENRRFQSAVLTRLEQIQAQLEALMNNKKKF